MSTLRRSLLPLIILLQLHILSGGPAAAKVPALIVFGDSTVDTGNNNYISTVIRSDFAPYGRDLRVGGGGGTSGQPTVRFSNGRLAVDFISEAFGLPLLVPAYLDPNADMSSLATGACFASAGAGYDNATSDLFVSRQPATVCISMPAPTPVTIESFGLSRSPSCRCGRSLTTSRSTPPSSGASWATTRRRRRCRRRSTSSAWAPTTSWRTTTPCRRAARRSTRRRRTTPATSSASRRRSRARKLDLNGLPPMGCLPLERRAATGACTEEYNAAARGFNAGLRDLVARLDSGGLGGGARVVYGDVYGAVAEVLADPAAHGFEDVGAGCCGATGRFEMGYMCNAASPLTCADAGKYAFWDAIHPTERLHRFIADRKMNTTLYEFL